MVFNNNLLLGAAGQGGGYTIDQSIRFNDDDSAYLTRTPGSAGNRKKFTISWWWKPSLSAVSANDTLFEAYNGANDFFAIIMMRDDATYSSELYFQSQVANVNVINKMTAQVFRDPSSWYHCVLVIDTDNATAEDRNKLYVNGVRVTSWFSGVNTNASSGHTTYWNNTNIHYIGRASGGSYFDGYMAEIYNIDGQALDPSSFGKVNADTGQWVPIAYTGSMTGNSFYITGADSADLGADNSGNGNDFTSSGLTSADQMPDTPTANQSTLNPLWAGATLSDGNLVATASTTSYQWALSNFDVSDGGKWVAEFQKSSGTFGYVGLYQLGNHTATSGNNYGYFYNLGTGEIVKNASVVTDLGTGAANSLMRLEYDSATDTLEFFDDGSSIYSATTGLTGHNSLHFGCAPYASGTIITATFSPLSGTPTANFKELTAANLPDPTIADPSAHFQTVLDTGANIKTTAESLYTDQFEWIKDRANANNHQLIDSVRGTSAVLQSNSTGAETTYSTPSGNSVGWVWKANGTGSSNTDGSTTSTVSADTTSGFSIATYTGTGSAATIGHGLGVAPDFILVKKRVAGTDDAWIIWHQDLPGPNYYLNFDTGAQDTSVNYWNNTLPTSSVFSVGASNGTNQSTKTFVAYLWNEVEGFSKFGSYTGNGSTDGPFVYCGFTPRWVLIKSTGTESWPMLDTARGSGNFGSAAGTGGDNPTAGNDLNAVLVASTSAAEEDNPTGSRRASFNSNGFKVRTTNSAMNTNGQKYIFAAFAEFPFRYANAR